MAAIPLLYGLCAGTYALLAAVMLLRPRPSGTALALGAAAAVTAAWAATVAAEVGGGLASLSGELELVRSLAWYGFVLALYRRAIASGQRQRIFVWLGGAAVVLVAFTLLRRLAAPDAFASLGSLDIDARLALAVCNLLLIENLYRSSGDDIRWHVGLPAVGLAALFLYDIAFYADAVLFRRFSHVLVEGRAITTMLVAPLLLAGAARNRRWGIDIRVSRTVAFHSATLLASGIFLLGLAAVGEVFRRFGPSWGHVGEISLLFAGVVGVAVLATSGSARSQLRSLVVEHFYSSRYDYRREWMRCIGTLATPDSYVALHTRVIRAVADVVDSPAGVLFLADSPGAAFRWAGSWNLPAAEQSVLPEDPLIGRFRGGEWIVVAAADERWIEDLPSLWLAVPLNHGGRLIGFVLAAAPRARFALDREVFDLLRVVGREVAAFVVEQRASAGLAETRRLHDYGRRFAFVAHDIKNVAGQLSLLLANAEHHLENPEFQRDMLATVRASLDKITALLTRLQAPEAEPPQALVAPLPRLEAIVAARRQAGERRIHLEADGSPAQVVMSEAAFDAVLAHLLDNAIEASATEEIVRLRLRQEGARLLLDIIDRGSGMSPEFVRDDLFRPFLSSKKDGWGVGVFQARELLREAGGDLLVMSAPGRGTTMRLVLPLFTGPASQPLRETA